jgi:AraC-type DNA-binding domain-containing proteins
MFKPIAATNLANGCKFDMSCIDRFSRELDTHALSIKFTIDGRERYQFNGKDHVVNTGQFLVINNRRSRVIIDSDTMVKGFCVGLPYALLDEIMNAHTTGSQAKRKFIDYIDSDNFFERVNNANNSKLGTYLQVLSSTLQSSMAEHSKMYIEQLFLRLAELSVESQFDVFEGFSAIEATNTSTQKHIYRKLLDARDYMDANLAYDIKIEDVAAIADLSQYYFYRMFKLAFRRTPYQYLLARRMDLARKLLQQGMAVSYVAYETGFTDVHTFSKAFKKWERLSPTHYIEHILAKRR